MFIILWEQCTYPTQNALLRICVSQEKSPSSTLNYNNIVLRENIGTHKLFNS